jgi:hypothetical protein
MENPTVRMRFTPYQLARGLKTIRDLEPEFHLMSLPHLVQTIYNDYLAKMSLNTTDIIPQDIIDEIFSHISKRPTKKVTLNSILEAEHLVLPEKELPITYEKAEISSVSDFSPPSDWKEED